MTKFKYCCNAFTDIRERFHYVVLLGTVLIGNLKQFNWNAGMGVFEITVITNYLGGASYISWWNQLGHML